MRLTLFTEFGLSLLDGGNNHVTNTSIGKPVQACTESVGFDEEQAFGTAVVSAVNNCTDWETQRKSEFGTRSTST